MKGTRSPTNQLQSVSSMESSHIVPYYQQTPSRILESSLSISSKFESTWKAILPTSAYELRLPHSSWGLGEPLDQHTAEITVEIAARRTILASPSSFPLLPPHTSKNYHLIQLDLIGDLFRYSDVPLPQKLTQCPIASVQNCLAWRTVVLASPI